MGRIRVTVNSVFLTSSLLASNGKKSLPGGAPTCRTRGGDTLPKTYSGGGCRGRKKLKWQREHLSRESKVQKLGCYNFPDNHKVKGTEGGGRGVLVLWNSLLRFTYLPDIKR